MQPELSDTFRSQNYKIRFSLHLSNFVRFIGPAIKSKKPLLHQAEEVFHIKELCGVNRFDILVPA